ncbi:MAG: DNA polymerase III subunit delta [Phycisphaerae bacterium]|nr:DNA polymerase III subunit delta [Phycisphaerae bacterium]
MKRYKPIYVIAGKEESLVNEQCRRMLDELVEPSERATGLFKADPKEVTAADILDELRTAPFLTDKRVVVIKGADDFVSQNREILEKYFDNPCPTGVLILTVNSWPGNTKLARKLPKVGKLVSVTQPKASQLPGRLVQYASDAYSKGLSKDAAELLVELTGDDLVLLYSEIDKLALFADSEKTITTGHIEKLIGHNRIFGAFAVIDKCLAGDAGAAVERLRNMFASDKSTEFSVVGAFAFHFRRMFNAKVLLEKGVRQAEIINQLRIWGNKDSFFSQLRKMSLKQIGDGIQQLAEIDYAIKTGRTKPQVAIEQLVLRLTAVYDTH